MSTLVTGGAGYIGAHVVRLLQESGEKVVVVDDLSTGDPRRIGDAPLVVLDISKDEATKVLTETMIDYDVDAVIHFAAQKQVGVSVKRPSAYFRENIGGMANLTSAMYDAGVRNIVFSSSAAVYGQPDVDMVSEGSPTVPINPYGQTKLIGEWLLKDCKVAWGLNFIALRYFNAAGAGWKDLADPAALNLIPLVEKALAQGKSPVVFGDGYPTPDGSCIRDYVHVLDLAAAHLVALDALRSGEVTEGIFNVGTGQGSSVFEVMESVRSASGQEFEAVVASPRAGDPAVLVADASAIRDALGWRATLGLDDIVQSSWDARGNAGRASTDS